MISLTNANSPWIPHTNPSDLSIPENTLLGMEDASSWKSTAGSPINLDTMSKDTAAAFDNEWFIAAPHEVLEQETAPTGILSLEALQLQSFLSPTSTMMINNHAQQQTQTQTQQQQSIVLDSDGSIMLDENGHIISSPVKKKKAGLTAMCSSPSPRKSSVSSPQTGSLNVFQHSTILKPLSPTPPCTGARPTLFQKRALSRSGGIFNPSVGLSKLLVKPGNCITPDEESPNITRDQNGLRRHLLFTGQAKANQQPLKSPLKRKAPEDDWDDMENTIDEDDESGDGSGVAHELGNGTKANTGSGNCMKSSKKGMPAKNLLAERRRRKKLNDRLYTLRSVVPKITKMDRASILGDAIEYLKELIQKIKDLHNELEAQNEKNSNNVNPQALTPTSSSPQRRGLVKEESSASKPMEPSQPARIEVKMRDGKDFNIHMLCGTRPGLLLSMMKALDGLGLDVQQAVISCFNGFVFDIFRAEAMKEGEVGPEEIKTVLLHTAGCHSVIG